MRGRVNKMKVDWARLNRIYESAKRHFVYIILFLILLYFYTPLKLIKSFYYAAAIASLFIMIKVIFDIEDKISQTKKVKEIFNNVHEIFPIMEKTIAEEVTKNGELDLKILGLTLFTAWPWVKMNLIENQKIRIKSIYLQMLLMDPVGLNIGQVGESWKIQADANLREIDWYLRKNKETLQERKVYIEVNKYDYIPTIHGFIVNDKHLFISFCIWDNNILTGADMPYQYFKRDPEDTLSLRYFYLFNNWFNHLWRK